MPKKKPLMPPLLLKGGAAAPDDAVDPDREPKPFPIKCISPLSLLKHRNCSRRAEKLSDVYGQWRAEQRAIAGRMERQLRTRRELDDLVDAHLARFEAHYNRSALPLRPREIARFMDPPWNPPLANAALSWLGDWRPSSIIALIPALSSFSPSSSALSALAPRQHRALAETIRRLRVQEAVLDQEVNEWRATGAVRMAFEKAAAVEEVGKMEAVFGRAQRLRYKALELAAKRVLDRNQAAEFLVAFAGVQEFVHRHAERWRARVGPVSITVQAFSTDR